MPAPPSPPSPRSLLDRLRLDPRVDERVLHVEHVPAREGAAVRQVVDALEGVVEDGRARAGTALATSGARRWPWSVGAALLGAAAGAAVVLLARRVVGEDAPDAQEPEQLQAVVDVGPPLPPAP